MLTLAEIYLAFCKFYVSTLDKKKWLIIKISKINLIKIRLIENVLNKNESVLALKIGKFS